MPSDERNFEFRLDGLPMPTLPLLATSDRQDLFSMNFVQAIVAAAGYNTKQDRLDRRKTDLEIILPDVVDDISKVVALPKYSSLRVQVKCSYACTINNDNTIHYVIDVNTQRFLTDPRQDPRILVLVHVPNPTSNGFPPWVTVNSDHTILRNRAYWLSLMGQEVSANGSVTVRIPVTNIFDMNAVATLMQRLVVQGEKGYAG